MKSFILCLLTLCALSSCKSLDEKVDVDNLVVYGDKGPLGAHYKETLSGDEGNIDKPTWDKLRVGMVCLNSDDWTLDQTTIETLCTDSGDCDYDTQSKVVRLIQTINSVKATALKAKHDQQ